MKPRIESLSLVTADTEYSIDLGNVRKFTFKLRNSAISYRYAYKSGVVAPAASTGTAKTFNVANPGTFTWAVHGLSVGQQVTLAAGAGSVPTGTTAAVMYYVATVPSVNTFTISATRGGTPIEFTNTAACNVILGEVMTVPAGGIYSDNFASENGSQIKIYFAASTAAQIVDVEAW